MSRALYSALFAVLLLHSAATSAQHNSASHAGAAHAPTEAASPSLAGQAAFAAIQEIVALLAADPHTDWSTVDITALRAHLIDMHLLTLQAEVSSGELTNGAEFHISTAGAAGAAVRRMVPPHARELDRRQEWSATTDLLAHSLRFSVTAEEPGEVAKIQALGFFGLMATGAHHQAHHLAIAKGMAPH